MPGRIEVLGKHTDYAGGRSLLCAVERGICLIARPRADDLFRLVDASRSAGFEACLAEPHTPNDQDWFIYPAIVLNRVTRNFPSARCGLDAAFESDLPSAGGLSSSSALITAVFLALADANELDTSQAWRAELSSRHTLAGYAAAIENGQGYGSFSAASGVGTSGGSEDHTAILCCQPGMLSQYSFCPVRVEEQIPLPSDLLFAVAVSGVAARKTGNAKAQYNRAARLAGRVLELCNQRLGRAYTSLADALQHNDPHQLRDVLHRASDSEFSSGALVDRFTQFVEESENLVPAASRQLQSGDLTGFGRTVARSQEHAERLLKNQVPETTALVTYARESGAVAASAFGAGFGGSVWALTGRDDARQFLDRWASAYRNGYPASAGASTFFLTRPGPAAFRLGQRVSKANI